MERPLSDKRPLGPIIKQGRVFGQERIDVGGERAAEPFAVARRIQDEIIQGNEEARISERGIGTIKWEKLAGIKFTYGFSESSIDNDFSFSPRKRPTGRRQATKLQNLGGKAGELGRIMTEAFNVEWRFTELDASSIVDGGFGAFEFEYVGDTLKSEIVEGDLDAVV